MHTLLRAKHSRACCRRLRENAVLSGAAIPVYCNVSSLLMFHPAAHIWTERTFSPARMQSASRSTASVRRMLFSNKRVIKTSSSDDLRYRHQLYHPSPSVNQDSLQTRVTHLSRSYTLEAIGLISELINKNPSYGRSSRGLTISA